MARPEHNVRRMHGHNEPKLHKKRYLQDRISDRTRIIIMAVISVIFILTLLLFSVTIMLKGKVTLGIISALVALALAFGFARHIKTMLEDIKKGISHRDERSKQLLIFSASKAFYISIYWVLGLMWYNSLIVEKFSTAPLRDIDQALVFSILGMAVIFVLCYSYYRHRGLPDLAN